MDTGNICDFAHYMVHTEDREASYPSLLNIHIDPISDAEVADLFKHAGVPFP